MGVYTLGQKLKVMSVTGERQTPSPGLSGFRWLLNGVKSQSDGRGE
jgi:hypothetical protein